MFNKVGKFIIILIMLLLLFLGYLFYPHTINLELISQLDCGEYNYSSPYWKTIYNDEDKFLIDLRRRGVEVPDIDFEKNNIIISIGKEIVAIRYRKAIKLHNMEDQPYVGNATYGNTQEGVILVYRIKKIKIMYDIFKEPI